MWLREAAVPSVPSEATVSLEKVLQPSVKVTWLLIKLSTNECQLHTKLTRVCQIYVTQVGEEFVKHISSVRRAWLRGH